MLKRKGEDNEHQRDFRRKCQKICIREPQQFFLNYEDKSTKELYYCLRVKLK